MTIKRHSSHRSLAEAEAEVKRLKRKGENARVRRDPLTGKFIVEIIFLGLALGLLGNIFRQS